MHTSLYPGAYILNQRASFQFLGLKVLFLKKWIWIYPWVWWKCTLASATLLIQASWQPWRRKLRKLTKYYTTQMSSSLTSLWMPIMGGGVSHSSSNSDFLFSHIICLHVLLPVWPGLLGPSAKSTHDPLVTDDMAKSPSHSVHVPINQGRQKWF